MRQVEVRLLAAAAEVVDLAGLALPPRGLDAAAVVEDVNPVADLLPVAVDRHRLVVQQVVMNSGISFSGNWYGP